MNPSAALTRMSARRRIETALGGAAAGLAAIMAISALALEPDAAGAARPSTGVLTIRMHGFRDDRGQARVTLFCAARGFPDNTNTAFRIASADIRNNTAVVEFAGIPFGDYAVGVLHDGNGNHRMDTNWLGIPREGYGASGDVQAQRIRPVFESSRFRMDSPFRAIDIRLIYAAP